MSSNQENTIYNLPRRPRIAEAATGAILGALAVGLFTGGLGGALLGAAGGSVIANQPQPLEMAVREYFAKLNLEVIFFNRAPRAVKVTFRYRAHAFWTIRSVIPDDLSPTPEDVDDWLYGSLITRELPKALAQINSHKAR